MESARSEATGYSFPSGPPQSSVGVFGSIARYEKAKWLSAVCIAICFLVPLSRLYLGVHTPLDVGVSLGISLVLIFGLFPFIQNCFEDTNKMRILFMGMIILSVLYCAFVNFYNFPKDTDVENLSHGVANAFKLLGCTLGVWIGFEVDRKYINFETKGNFLCHVLKFVVGLVPLLAIKEGLKYPFNLLFGISYIADGVRYLILVVFAVCVWPLTFNWFRKITKSN